MSNFRFLSEAFVQSYIPGITVHIFIQLHKCIEKKLTYNFFAYVLSGLY